MAEYIEREALIKHIERSFGEISTPFVVKEIKDFPNADVVPVEWISVKDRLPEEKERVLVFLKNNTHTKGYTRIDTDRLIKGNWIRWSSCVTHWMPFPELPKSEQKLKEMRGD